MLSLVLLGLALYILLGECLCHYAFSRNGKFKKNIEKNHQEQFSDKSNIDYWNKTEKIYIESQEGIKLCGFFKDGGNNKIALIIHGFGGNHVEMAKYAKMFEQLGCDVLAIDNRAHGESDGKYLSFGQNEKHDVEKWIEKVLEINPNYKVIVFGISMGATTSLLTSHNHSDSIAAIIADCGYASASEQLRYFYNSAKKKPMFVYKFFIDYAKRTKKIDIKNINAEKCVKDTKCPILLFHGEDDKFVQTENAHKIFASIPKGMGELHILPNARHCECMGKHPGLYKKIISEFFNKYNI